MLTPTLLTTLELPALPTISEYEFRALRREDVPALYDLWLLIEQADDRNLVNTLADLQRDFDDPSSVPETDSLAAFTGEGQLVGLARTFQNPQLENEAHCFLRVEVHPTRRGSELEETLLNWAEERGRQRLLLASGPTSRTLRCGVEDKLTARRAQWERRGFQIVRHFNRMRRDLSEPIPAVQLPVDLALRVYMPELSGAVHAAYNEAFRDHWSFNPATFEEWQQYFVGQSSFRSDLTYVVMAGDEVAGFSLNNVSVEKNGRHGRSEGWIDELAVRRPWRKRGVATALLCATMHAFKAEGLQEALLGVDTQNLSGALRVYERVGFKPIKRFMQYEKAVE